MSSLIDRLGTDQTDSRGQWQNNKTKENKRKEKDPTDDLDEVLDSFEQDLAELNSAIDLEIDTGSSGTDVAYDTKPAKIISAPPNNHHATANVNPNIHKRRQPPVRNPTRKSEAKDDSIIVQPRIGSRNVQAIRSSYYNQLRISSAVIANNFLQTNKHLAHFAKDPSKNLSALSRKTGISLQRRR